MCFLPITNHFKILRIKIKSVCVKDFLISTKVKPMRIEHLQDEGIFSSELYFNISNDIETLKWYYSETSTQIQN